MTIPLSVVIIAKNEQKRIVGCLESVHGWADEIIIVDDESTDETCSLARKFTDKIFKRKMDLEGRQRNFGADQARHDWVLILDCDERPTAELKADVEKILRQPDSNVVAYWVPQINYLGDVHLKYGGWSNPHLRLYKRQHLRWSEAIHDVVHPGMTLASGYRGANLQSFMIHYGFSNIEDLIKKVNRQSTLEAVKWHLSGRKIKPGKAAWRTVDRFFRRWIGKKGYKDGFYGFVAAVMSGLYQWFMFCKYREIKEKGMYGEIYEALPNSSSKK